MEISTAPVFLNNFEISIIDAGEFVAGKQIPLSIMEGYTYYHNYKQEERDEKGLPFFVAFNPAVSSISSAFRTLYLLGHSLFPSEPRHLSSLWTCLSRSNFTSPSQLDSRLDDASRADHRCPLLRFPQPCRYVFSLFPYFSVSSPSLP